MQNENNQTTNSPNSGNETPRKQGPASDFYIELVEKQRNAPRKPNFR